MKFSFRIFFFIFFISPIAVSQTLSIQGVVKSESDSLPIEGASVVVKKGNNFLGYTYSDPSGLFSIDIDAQESFKVVLEVNYLGYNPYKDTLSISEHQSEIKRMIFLSEKEEQLSTVVIKSHQKIEINRDTIAYRLSAFKKGTEKNVEDILKNLPGIEVGDDGTIRALGKPIQKILIEGDDLADNNYKVISKNLDPSVLQSIEIINNYDENPVLKQFLKSDNVVLNLKLRDDKKSLVFGKIDFGAGVEHRYLGDVNIALINPNFKILDLGFANNTGRTANSQFNNYELSVGGFNDFSKSFEMSQNMLVNLKGAQMELEDKYYVDNQSFSNSIMFNKKYGDDLKIKNTLYTFQDNFKKNYSIGYTYFVPPDTFYYNELNAFEDKQLNLGNDFQIQFAPSTRSHLIFSVGFLISDKEDVNALFTDGNNVDQKLNTSVKNFDSQLQYTKKIRNGAWIVDAFVGLKNNKDSFFIEPNRFLLDAQNTNSVLTSRYDSSFDYYGVESALVFKSGKTSHSYTVGLLNTKESIAGRSQENVSPVDSLSGVDKANNLQPKAQFKLEQAISKSWMFNVDVEGAFSFYRRNSKVASFFIPNIDVNLKLVKTSTGNYSLGWKYNSKMERLDKYIDFFIVKNYRTIGLGAIEVKPLEDYRYYFSHTYSNLKRRLFFNTSLSYIQFKNQFTFESFLDENLNISRRLYASGQDLVFFNSNVTTYLKGLDMSLKLGYSYRYAVNPSIVNDSKIETFNNSSTYVITGTSYFKSFFNFKVLISYMDSKGWNLNDKLTNSRFKTELNPVFKPSNEWLINLRLENYVVDSQFYDANQIELEYTPMEKNWSLGMYLQNILNKKAYNFNYIANYTHTETAFQAIPFYGCVYWKFKF